MKQIQGVMLIRLVRDFSSSNTPSPNDPGVECARVLSAATIFSTFAGIAEGRFPVVTAL